MDIEHTISTIEGHSRTFIKFDRNDNILIAHKTKHGYTDLTCSLRELEQIWEIFNETELNEKNEDGYAHVNNLWSEFDKELISIFEQSSNSTNCAHLLPHELDKIIKTVKQSSGKKLSNSEKMKIILDELIKYGQLDNKLQKVYARAIKTALVKIEDEESNRA